METFVQYIQPFLPDLIIRFFLKIMLWNTRLSLDSKDYPQKEERLIKKIKSLKTATFDTKEANEQHYEVPTSFFLNHLGNFLKYSSCEWNNCRNLNEAELFTITEYQEHLKLTQLEPGDFILEIGNGWGSLCLSNASKFPHLNFESFSNSETQIKYIEDQCKQREIKNLKVWKQDMDEFITDSNIESSKYSRIISIECIEHCRGYGLLFEKMANVLKDNGFCFLQILGHSQYSYLMNNNSWMGRNFFTGGTIPSMHLLDRFNDHLIVKDKIILSGSLYSKTLDSWLNNLYLNKQKIMEILHANYGAFANKYFQGWRMFYLMSSEAFKYNEGKDWCVGYFFLEKR